MKVLIVYGTTEGQTRKIAQFIADTMTDAGHSVEVVDGTNTRDVVLDRFDKIVVAASVHLSHFHDGVLDFAERHHETLKARNAAFVPVSLSAASDDQEDIDGIHACVETFIRQTGWQPAHVEHVAGAFRFSRIDFFKTWALRHIADKKGIKVNPDEDLELTDWDALAAFSLGLVSAD